VSGLVPSGKLAVCGSTYFGEVDCGIAQKSVTICNVGDCELRVEAVRFKRERRHFSLVNNPFPATLHPGSCLCVVIQYRANCEPESCELEIISDDPHELVRVLDVVAYTACRKPCCSCSNRSCECRREEAECQQR